MPKILFGEGSDDEDEQLKEEFVVNESYAKRYDQWRRKEEFQKLKDKYGDADDVDSDSSSSEDDYVEPDNPKFDDEFYKVISAIKSHDPEVSEKEFFKESFAMPSKKEDEEKPMTIRDFERNRLLEKGGNFEDSDEELRDFDRMVGENMKSKQKSLNKSKVKKTRVGFEDDGIIGSDNEDDGLLTKKKKKDKCHKRKNPRSPTEVAAWEAKDKRDKWLKDFFVNKRYLEGDSDNEDGQDVIDEETISEDEKTLNDMEDFAAKYNFRFLEPDGLTIRSYPREIKGSIREKSNKRKLERDRVAAMKQERKEVRRQEITQLKELRQKDILDRIEKLKDTSGLDKLDEIRLMNELKEDFDPEKHEATMKAMFSGDYYDETEDNDQKPVFPDDDDMYNDYDDWLEKNQKYKDDAEHEDMEENAGHWNEDFDMDADHYENEEEASMDKPSTSKKKENPKLAEILSQKKREFDPEKETFEKYYDEYYNLEFEDIVAGMPVRFNYRPVEPNSFGLTTEEILSCKDSELNKWYSINKILRHDRKHEQEVSDAVNYANRAKLTHIKLKYLPSLFAETPEDELAAEMEKKRLKNRDKKMRKQKKKEAELATFESSEASEATKIPTNTDANVDSVSLLPKEKKRKKLKNKEISVELDKSDETVIDVAATSRVSNKKKLIDTSANDNEVDIPQKQKKRKMNENSEVLDVREYSNKKFKNNKLSNKKLWKKSQNEKLKSNTFIDNITDARLKALGANPKKIRGFMKYKDKPNN